VSKMQEKGATNCQWWETKLKRWRELEGGTRPNAHGLR